MSTPTNNRFDEARKSFSKHAKEPGFLGDLVQKAKLVWYLVQDAEVPIHLKLIPLLALGYVIWPVDFIPDIIPGLGQLDDITAVLFGAKMFIDMAPQHIVDQYLLKIKGLAPEEDDTIVIEGKEI